MDIIVNKIRHDDTIIKTHPLQIEVELQLETGSKVVELYYKVFGVARISQ